MANQEHLDILKQGVGVWNKWREENPKIRPDLKQAKLVGLTLHKFNFFGADFFGADLHSSSLNKCNLNKTTLSHVDLRRSDLTEATCIGSDLIRANLSETTLYYTDLSITYLTDAYFIKSKLKETNFSSARMALTTFVNVDLCQARGLETVIHDGPSNIDIYTLFRSEGNISELFLRGIGIPDSFITYAHSLISNPIEYYTCFISYSGKDQEFAERLHADLQSKGVRCWFAPEDMKIGDKIRPRIDESIRLYDKLLLVLSERSVMSEWVEYEVEVAMGKEQLGKPPVLFPIRLDKVVMESTTAWAAHIRRTRHIGNFEHWEDHREYKKAFDRLLSDLKTGE